MNALFQPKPRFAIIRSLVFLSIFLFSNCSYVSYKIGKNLSKSDKSLTAGSFDEKEKLRFITKNNKVYHGYFNSKRSMDDSLCLTLEKELKCLHQNEIKKIKRLDAKEKNVGLLVGIGIDIFIIYYSMIAWLGFNLS